MTKKLRDIVPLTEISNKKLTQYRNAAEMDVFDKHKKNTGSYTKIGKRIDGIIAAGKRLHGISVKDMHDLKKDTNPIYAPNKLKEDRDEHMKKHGEKACEYAEKIKQCCEEFVKVAERYDDYELKHLARELEDIYERIDNNVSSKKEMKKRQDDMAKSVAVNPVYEDVEPLDELSKKTLKNYYRKAVNDRENAKTAMRGAISSFGHNDNRTARYAKDIIKRNKGIGMAIKKLTKEEVVDEGKFNELDIMRQEKQAKERASTRIKIQKKMGKRIVN